MTFPRTSETPEIKLAMLYAYVNNIWDILNYFYIYFITLQVSYKHVFYSPTLNPTVGNALTCNDLGSCSHT